MIADVSFRASTAVTKCQIVSLDSCEVPIMSRPQTNRTWNEHLPSVVRFPLSSVHEVAESESCSSASVTVLAQGTLSVPSSECSNDVATD